MNMYEQLESYIGYLTRKERSRATVNQYRRDISAFIIEMSRAAADGCVTKEAEEMEAGDIITVKYINSKDIPPADDSDTDTKTGDDTSLAIPAAVMAASLAAIAAVLAGIRRKSGK